MKHERTQTGDTSALTKRVIKNPRPQVLEMCSQFSYEYTYGINLF